MPTRSHVAIPRQLAGAALAAALLLTGPALYAQGPSQGGDPHSSGNPGQPSQGGGGMSGGGQPQGGHPEGGHGGQPGYAPHGGYAGRGPGHGFGPRGYAPYGGPPYRGHADWWRGHPAFVGYLGPRPGFYFAPGYGYYAPPVAFAHSVWVVGMTLPLPMRRYVVVQPVNFGLVPPPPGFGWYFAGTNFVLMSQSSGVIVQSVAGGW